MASFENFKRTLASLETKYAESHEDKAHEEDKKDEHKSDEKDDDKDEDDEKKHEASITLEQRYASRFRPNLRVF